MGIGACWRKSGVVSMTTTRPSNSSMTEGRVRLSWGSGDWQTGQLQARVGTPVDVPVPRKVSFISPSVHVAARVPQSSDEAHTKRLPAAWPLLLSSCPGSYAAVPRAYQWCAGHFPDPAEF